MEIAPNYNIDNFIKLFQEILLIIDSNSKKTITNFAKYKNLLFISSKYMGLSLLEKQKFTVEILFNIFQCNFDNDEMNIKINNQLNAYNYYYSLDILWKREYVIFTSYSRFLFFVPG